MAVVLQILITFFTLPTSGTTTQNSSVSSELYLYNALSEYMSPKLNSNTSTFSVDDKTNSRVTITTPSDVEDTTSESAPEITPGNHTDTVSTNDNDSVNDETFSRVSTAASDVKPMAVHNLNGSVSTDSIPPTTDIVDNTMTTGDNSVPGQGAHSQTVRSKSSARNSGIDTTVTTASENTDTVPGSIHIRSKNDDLTTESVFTSVTVTTVPTVSSSFHTDSSTTLTKDCETMLCEKDAGYFVINTTACVPYNSTTIVTAIPTTVEILKTETSIRPNIICLWNIKVPLHKYVNVTIDQLVLEKDEDKGIQALEFQVENDYKIQVFNMSVLRNRSVTFTSSSSFLFFRFRGQNLHLASAITFHFLFQPGAVVEDLPVVRVTDTVSYVTSPRFNGLDLLYPNRYDGVFELDVTDDECVLISFTHFSVEQNPDCMYDYLEFSVTALNHTWTKCGQQDIPSRVYHSSVHLLFHTDESFQLTGFMMMYAILPRSQEPQQLSENLYNCSVPHFHSFRPLLKCNRVTECQGNEDEEDCGYYSNDCGHGALDAGNKCYIFARNDGTKTWDDAHQECIQDNQNLVTLSTPKEVGIFRQIMASRRNPLPVYIGAQLVARLQNVPAETMYKYLWKWVDGRTAIFLNITTYETPPRCAYYHPGNGKIHPVACREFKNIDLVCEFYKLHAQSVNESKVKLVSSVSVDLNDALWNVTMVQCPSGHVTRDFLLCDTRGQCGAKESMTSCHSGSVTIPMFVCERSHEAVHYTLVCDNMQHCDDNTDEDFCDSAPCPPSRFRCLSGQCIGLEHLCDSKSDCYDGSDEVCAEGKQFVTTLPPAILHVDGKGRPFLRQMNDSDECPLTHFQCTQGFCLPIYLRCNGVDDCPNREDEASCESYTCSGFYRCRGSKACLHPDHVCDGLFQCPQFDDELLCDRLACPDVCHCEGLAFVCTANFSASSYPALRYLDASGSGMTSGDLAHNLFLIHLRLSDCRIDTQPTLELPNLRQLDLSRNELTHIDINQFHPLKNLRVLVLFGNPLSAITNTESSGKGTLILQTINLSGASFHVFNGSALAGCPVLKTLNISWSKLTTISEGGFQSTPLLENVDVRGSPLKDFPSDVLRGLDSLKVVHADNYKLCCKAMLPEDFDLNKCHAKQDLLASCEDLLKSNVYRVFLWLFSSLSVVGNVGSFAARVYLGNKSAGLGSFSIFVASLSMADFFMGIYLAIVGVADQIYRGEYLWYSDRWKESAVCKMAGFLSLMSSEVSAFIICLITLDRFLALRFPLSSLHFSHGSALIACSIVWMVGIALATVPLLPVTTHWQFYSQTGICIPLPFTTDEYFQGYDYSFSVMIILNFVLFLLIAVGQAIIYWSVRSNSISSSKKTGSRDVTIARRLTTIVLSDFLCWFPVGLLGVLASTGTIIPDELNVTVAIFVMPFNSALNPFLYTFNVLMEKRKKAQEARLLKRLESQMHTERTQADTSMKIPLPVNRSTAVNLVKAWLNEQVLTPRDIESCSAAICDVEKSEVC